MMSGVFFIEELRSKLASISYFNRVAERFDRLNSSARKDADLIASIQCNLSKLMMHGENFTSLVEWTHTSTFSRLSISSCNLDAVDRSLARTCFANAAPRGIVLIGDSLTRYQYLNLVYFLVHGVWSAEKSLPNENEHYFTGGWNQFYQITNGRMGGREICDCYREDAKNIVENRYFNDGEVRLSYRQAFGDTTPILMHDVELLNVSSCGKSPCTQSLCLPGACSEEVLPVQNLGTLLQVGSTQDLLDSYPASLIFFNSGLWWQRGERNTYHDHRDHLVSEALRFRSTTETRLHWKMTTANRDPPMPPEFAFARSLVEAGAFDAVFDAWSLTAPIAQRPGGLMWDRSHFEAAVYEGLNRALVAYVCSLPRGS